MNIETKIASYVEALHPILYIHHFDFKVVDDVLAKISEGVNVVEFNNALGMIDFKNKVSMLDCDLCSFLMTILEDGFDHDTFIILKDIHKQLDNDRVIALLKRIAENNLYNDNYNATIFIISDTLVIPKELENFITVVDFPLPSLNEIVRLMDEFVTSLGITLDVETRDEIALSFKGMNEFQIRQTLNLAYQDGGTIDKSDRNLILKEKEQFVKKSGMLEIVNFNEKISDIGGLENLKEWLEGKAKIFNDLDKALKFGVDIPKGILIVGMPGCGKSLTAKATAGLFELPLVRLDVGRLLGKYVGESEDNMRKALQLSEAISPCVLWIDEIEKAFVGVGNNDGAGGVTTRLFGQFLTWMQEKENTVFIVATANNISNLPPEFLRKGRFDELFSVLLPNDDERGKIIKIHLQKRNQWDFRMQLKELVGKTEGYSGADIEALIKSAIEKAFIQGKPNVSMDDLVKETDGFKSISDLLSAKPNSTQNLTSPLERMKNTIEQLGIKSASK